MKTLMNNKRSIVAIGLVTILISLLIPQTAAAKPPAGIDPNNPIEIAMVPGQTIVEKGKLVAGQEAWFAVKVSDVYGRYTDDEDGGDRPPLDLTLFVTPVDGNKIQHIDMDLFPGSYAGHWSAGHLYTEGLDYDDDANDLPPAPFGAGRVVDRADQDEIYVTGEGDSRVGQLTWSGRVTDNEPFLVRISNNNGSAVDYALYTDNVIDVQLGQAVQTKTAVASETAMAKLPAGIDPNNPIEIAMVPGQTIVKTDKLAAGQEAWFAVKVSDVYGRYTDDEDGGDRPPLDLTLFVTPVDGNKIQHIDMDLFPGSYAGHWSAGHLYTEGLDYDDDANDLPPAPFGAGRVVDRADEDDVYITGEGDPILGTLKWSGRVTDNETFLVRIQNGNGSAVDFALYTDDIIDVEF